jgi:hypothetical protein
MSSFDNVVIEGALKDLVRELRRLNGNIEKEFSERRSGHTFNLGQYLDARERERVESAGDSSDS